MNEDANLLCSTSQSIASSAHDLAKLRVRDVTHGEHIVPPGNRHAVEDPAPGAIRNCRANTRDHRILDPVFGVPPRGLPIPQPPCVPLRICRRRQYARIVGRWVREIGFSPSAYGTHTLRRTKASLMYRRTKNLRAVQLLLGHSRLESTVRYLGIEVDDALEMAEQTEV